MRKWQTESTPHSLMSMEAIKELEKKVDHYDKHKTYDRAEEVWRENLKGPWDKAHRSQNNCFSFVTKLHFNAMFAEIAKYKAK